MVRAGDFLVIGSKFWFMRSPLLWCVTRHRAGAAVKCRRGQVGNGRVITRRQAEGNAAGCHYRSRRRAACVARYPRSRTSTYLDAASARARSVSAGCHCWAVV